VYLRVIAAAHAALAHQDRVLQSPLAARAHPAPGSPTPSGTTPPTLSPPPPQRPPCRPRFRFDVHPSGTQVGADTSVFRVPPERRRRTPRSPVRSRSRGVPALHPREWLERLHVTAHASGSRPRDAPHAPRRRNGRRRGSRHDLSSARASPRASTAPRPRRERRSIFSVGTRCVPPGAPARYRPKTNRQRDIG